MLEYLILYLVLDNEAQIKLQNELDTLAKTKEQREGCLFTLADRTQLNYTMAVCEVNIFFHRFLLLYILKKN